jgi:outer membrane protein TolC
LAAEEAHSVQVFSLAQAVDAGLRDNPRLRAAAAAVERGRGQEQVAFAPFLPQVDLLSHFGQTSRVLGPAAAGATGIILANTEGGHAFGQAELQLQWTIYDFGRTEGRYRQAVARESIAEFRYARAKQTVAYDVGVAYLEALRASAGRVIQEEAIRRAEATLGDVRARRAAGVADRDDVLRGEVQLSAARDGLEVATEAELDALARLNNFMGRNASLPLRLVDWDSEPDFSRPLAECLNVAAARRPEVGVAREAVAAAQAGRTAAAAEFKPRVYTLGSVGGVGGSNVDGGFQEGIGLHIDVPLYAGGRRRGELASAEAGVQEEVANAQSVLDAVSLEVTLAYRGVLTARRRIGYLRPAVAQARENLRLVRTKYRNGNATPTDVVDAETALTGAQQRSASATYEYLAALVRLAYALGVDPGQLLCGADGPARPPEVLPQPRPLPAEK